MSDVSPHKDPRAGPWTCPFCPLLCDGFGAQVEASDGPLVLTGSECARARAGLAGFESAPSGALPSIDGEPCELDLAVAAAARLLAASRQPLFGGLATDVAGARALYRLACETGAICDVAGGPALMHGMRNMQDRGGYGTSLAEIRTRADVLVCIGSVPTQRYPEFFRRCGIGEDLVAQRHVVVLGAELNDETSALANLPGVSVESIPLQADLFTTLATLAALVAGRRAGSAAPGLAALAARLALARYSVLVWEPGRLPDQGALIVERINQIVGALNATTRSAAFALGGDDGASTVNQVFTWLSGLPLRSRAAAGGLEHEPLCFDAERLLADGAVDMLLWVSSFGALPAVPRTTLPRVVLGHPAQAGAGVFIPVSTPGIGSAGHLFRSDGTMLMPLTAIYTDGLPSVAEVLQYLSQALRAQAGAA